MASTSSIEYHHIYPKARVRSYPRDLSNSIANLAFVSAVCNKKIGAKYPSDYLPAIPPERLWEQHVPAAPELWQIDAFPVFLEQRRVALVNVLNDMLGLPAWTPADDAGPDPTLDADEEEFSNGETADDQ